MTEKSKTRFGGQVFLGILLMLVGALFLADNWYYLDLGPVWRYWPLIFVLFGIQKLVNAEGREAVGSGAWLIFFGLWLFVSFNHIWGLDFGDSWPILIIGWGVSVIWKSLGRPARREKEVLS